VFLDIFQVTQFLCLVLHVFQFSRHNPGPTLCVSHFARFSVFLTIFQVLPCDFLIFLICQFSRHIPGPTVSISHCPRFLVFFPYSRSYSVCFSFFTFFSGFFFPIVQVLDCVFVFPRFSVFSPYSRSYSVHFSFFTFFSVSGPIPGHIPCLCLIFHLFKFSRHMLSSTVCVSHFPLFSVFSQYSRA
jgi:hypothetical protein